MTSAMARLAFAPCMPRWKIRPDPLRVRSQTPGCRCLNVFQIFWAPSRAREEYHTALPSFQAASGTRWPAAGTARIPAATATASPTHTHRVMANPLRNAKMCSPVLEGREPDVSRPQKA
jgi:hypothetical protein